MDKVPVSELCEELGLRQTVFYRWQKELFENGAVLLLHLAMGTLLRLKSGVMDRLGRIEVSAC